MNEELKQQLTQFLAKALDVAEKGINATGEQIPLILQEIVNYQTVYGVVNSVLIVLFLILGIILFFVARWGEDNDNFPVLAVGLVGSVISAFLSGVCLVNATVLIKALVAPRLVILEYLKGLL